MAWYWLISGCLLSGFVGFVLCARFVVKKEADKDVKVKGLYYDSQTRSDRRREWRGAWGYYRQ